MRSEHIYQQINARALLKYGAQKWGKSHHTLQMSRQNSDRALLLKYPTGNVMERYTPKILSLGY